MTPEYQSFVHQLTLYLPDLPLALIDIVQSYWMITKSMYLRHQSVIAITKDDYCLVIDPSTMKELRRVPVTPSLLSLLDRDRLSDCVVARQTAITYYTISPLDNDILVRVDGSYRSSSYAPQPPQNYPTNMFQIVTWVRLSSLSTTGPSTSSLSSSLPSNGSHVFDGAHYRLREDPKNDPLITSATSPWYSWCGRYMFCFESTSGMSFLVLDDPDHVQTHVQCIKIPGQSIRYDPMVHTFDLTTCQWLSLEQSIDYGVMTRSFIPRIELHHCLSLVHFMTIPNGNFNVSVIPLHPSHN
jgi:hypothetical protein